MTSTRPRPNLNVEGKDGLVEMAWDPITRIVGSLGIYTKIDFKQPSRLRAGMPNNCRSSATTSSITTR